MNDTQLLDWMQQNFTRLRDEGGSPRPFVMEYIGRRGETLEVEGVDLRDCIRGAVAGEGRRVRP